MPDHTLDVQTLLAEGFPGSVLLAGQRSSRALRSHRYVEESTAHPGKMAPTIARQVIRTYTRPGDLVADPMAGIATTLLEAIHLGRHAVGVEYEAQWVELAADNLRHAQAQGAAGTGTIYHGDSRYLPRLLPSRLHGAVALVLTSPPYGPHTHGRVTAPGPDFGKVGKYHQTYGATAGNLAKANHQDLADGFTQILTGCAAILRPDGHVVITARPYRHHDELVDIPAMVEAAGLHAGLELVETCIALIAGIRKGLLVPRASFFQRKNIRAAIADGDPQRLVQHEDLIVLRRAGSHCLTSPPIG